MTISMTAFSPEQGLNRVSERVIAWDLVALAVFAAGERCGPATQARFQLAGLCRLPARSATPECPCG